MSSLQSLAKSKAQLNKATKGMSVSEVEKLIAGLADVVSKMKERESKRASASRRAALKKIKAMMADSGVSAADLADSGKLRKTRAKTKAKKATKSVAAKYRLVVDGREHLWSGRGRAPVVFREHFEAGNSKESCLIAG